jgi:hypothetical protein
LSRLSKASICHTQRCIHKDSNQLDWIVTGSVLASGMIASIEFWAKFALYYLHERAWAKAH